MKPAIPKLSSPPYPKCTASPTAASAYAIVVGLMIQPAVLERI
jgi:hypothetical protein